MTEAKSTDPTVIPSFSFQAWRESFVRVILIWASGLGFIVLLATLFSFNDLLDKAVYSSVYVCLLAITAIRLPYTVRAGIFLALIYVLGLVALVETGIWGNALVFLLGFIVMNGLLFSPRAGINAIVFNIVSITIFGFLVLNGFYLLRSQGMPSGTLGDWLTGSASLLLLGSVALAGIYYFQSEFVLAQGRTSEIFKTLQEERKNLEKHVAERTGDLEKRNSGMQSMVYFTRQIAGSQDLSAIPTKAVDLLTQNFGHYHAGLFLLAEDGKTAILQAASSDEGRKLVGKGYRVEVGDKSLVGRVAKQARPIVASRNSNTPAADEGEAEMPRTRSEIALPMVIRGKVMGVLDIQSEQNQAFGQNEAEILQLITDQVGTSMENARLANEAKTYETQADLLNSQQIQSMWRENLINQKMAYQFSPSGIKSISLGAKPIDQDGLHIPLVLRGQEIGSIDLQRKDKAEWPDPDRDLAKKVATQVALALDNIRLIDETRLHAVQEQTVNEISGRFSRSLDVDTLLQTAVRELAALPDVSEASIFIKPSDENKNQI
jgi:GAF domain-containing protein